MNSSLRRTRVAVAAALATGLALTSCSGGGSSDEDSAAVSEDPFRVGMQMPTSLIPGNATGLFATTIASTLFSGLVNYDPQTGEPVNLIAESIESDDQQTWHITIEDGWTFHNGEPVDAESFARAWNAAADPDNAWVQASQFANIQGYAEVSPAEGEPTAETLSGVVVENDLELTVHLAEPDSQFPFLLGRAHYYPMPEAALADLEAFGELPIGNGPYQMVEPWTGGSEIVTERFEEYDGEKARNAGVVFRIYTGNDVAYTDYQAGELDLVTINSSDLPSATASYGDLIRTADKEDWRNYLSLPTFLQGYDNIDIRRALSMAIDRDAIIESLLNGDATPSGDYDLPVSAGYRDDACGQWCEYDPDAARALWDAAGGVEGELVITSVTGTGRDAWAEAIANQWAEAFDVQVRIDQIASENTWPAIISREVTTPVALGAPTNFPSPASVLIPQYSTTGSANGSHYANPAFDALLAEAAATGEPAEQQALYDQAKDILIEDMPSILLWNYGSTFVVSERAAEYQVDPFNKSNFAEYALTD